MIVFGPVPSRRLGRSMGINTIPPKICTYSCSYCQLGKTLTMKQERSSFLHVKEGIRKVQEKISAIQKAGETVDYLTFVADGEPTLERNLGEFIRALRPFNIKIALITNASLIDRQDVRDELCEADWVSLKVDTVKETTWHTLNHPLTSLSFSSILKGIETFSMQYEGILCTETMLVKDCNDTEEEARETSAFLYSLQPATAYLSIPTRPPADLAVQKPSEETLNQIFQLFTDTGLHAEYLIGYEGNEFSFTGDIEKDILNITSVHPMREDAVLTYLEKAQGQQSTIDQLVENKQLTVSFYNGMRYYIRKYPD